MTTDDKNQPTKSRFASHLSIMGLESSDGIDPKILKLEKRASDSMEVKPLKLPPEPKGSSFFEKLKNLNFGIQAGVFAAAACAVMLVVYLQKPVDPGWQVKGKTHVEIYYDRAGVVNSLKEGDLLANGDKIRVQVTASGDSQVYFGVVDRKSSLLSNQEEIWKQSLSINVGQKKFFPGSLELTGANEGETAVVVSCDSKKVEGLSKPELKAVVIELMTGPPSASNEAAKICSVLRARLR